MSKRRLKQQRILAVLLCLALLAMLMFCASMTAKHVMHSCGNNTCPVCEALHSSQHAFKQLALAACAAVVLAVLPNFIALGQHRALCGIAGGNSLVNLKIRINH